MGLSHFAVVVLVGWLLWRELGWDAERDGMGEEMGEERREEKGGRKCEVMIHWLGLGG